MKIFEENVGNEEVIINVDEGCEVFISYEVMISMIERFEEVVECCDYEINGKILLSSDKYMGKLNVIKRIMKGKEISEEDKELLDERYGY